jgi:hypothetical protein
MNGYSEVTIAGTALRVHEYAEPVLVLEGAAGAVHAMKVRWMDPCTVTIDPEPYVSEV